LFNNCDKPEGVKLGPNEKIGDTVLPLTVYDIQRAFHNIGSIQCARYLAERSFFLLGERLPDPKYFDGEYDKNDYSAYSYEPSFEFNDLMRFFYSWSMMVERPEVFMHPSWLSKKHVVDFPINDPIKFSLAESILFDVAEMYTDLKKFIPTDDIMQDNPYMQVSEDYRNFIVFTDPNSEGIKYAIKKKGTQHQQIMRVLVSNFMKTGSMCMGQDDIYKAANGISDDRNGPHILDNGLVDLR
jgi:hypothetical protein